VAINPPSDIVLDVARAGDPTRVQAAVDKLSRMAGPDAPKGAAFSDVLGATTPAPALRALPGVQIGSSPDRVPQNTNPYQNLEAVMLQGFVEYMMPSDSDGLYGDKAADGVMRGMFAEQIAMQMAKSGKLGIAKMMAKQHPLAPDDHKGMHPLVLPTALHMPALPPTGDANEIKPTATSGPMDLLAGSGST
jgi:flagellar protein FlgJ